MAFSGRSSGRDSRRGQAAKEERSLFPLLALVVIAACIGLWTIGAKIYQDQMAVYDSYTAVRQAVSGDTFFEGVSVDGIPLGGMTFEEAQAQFSGREQLAADAFSLTVQYGEKRWRITSEEVSVFSDAQTVLRRAFAVGRTGTLEERYTQIMRVKAEGAAFETGFDYDRSAIRELADIIADSLDREAKDASLDAFDVVNKTFTFTKEESGAQTDRTQLEQDILAALDAYDYDRVVVPVVSEVKPGRTLSMLTGRFGLIASYTTKTTKDQDRNTNIALSAAALNGRVVLPGETLSFNECTGKRTGEKGYREAGAIAGGVLVDDTGGGVCQTSSTLFNAVVRADLEIVKRSAHSWPSSYVEKGEDATVNWPSLDFVFRNNKEFPVFVVAWYANQEVTIEIHGLLLENGMTIDLDSKTVKTIKPSDEILYTLDESLPEGTRQFGRTKRTGYVVDTYKVYKDSEGNEISRSKLWTTNYPASQKEILYH
ncbi:MAG: VanW family protein [Clostridia bacterium]|nr:VanW family protein [Clostridia bacterium]